MVKFFPTMSISFVKFFAEIAIFLLLTGLGILIIKKMPKSSHKLFNPEEYLPKDEIHTLKQLSYLSLMAACFICVMYTFVFQGTDYLYFAILDIGVSLFIAITADKDTWFRKVSLILLVPYGSLTYLLFGYSLMGALDLIHIPIMIYYIKYYHDKFKEYTESNSLGITIILLFTIIFVSFINTIFVESKNPLDALVMVSNAFTSNGYAVLGNSVAGKIDSLILVWAGFIISGVGTATLTLAISRRYYNKKLEEINESIKNLEEVIKNKED